MGKGLKVASLHQNNFVLDLGRMFSTTNAKKLHVLVIKTDYGVELLKKLSESISDFGARIVHLQFTTARHGQHAECIAFIDLANSKTSSRNIEKFFKKLRIAKSAQILSHNVDKLVGNNHHSPLEILGERAVIFGKDVYAAIFKGIRDEFGTAGETFLYYLGVESGIESYMFISEFVKKGKSEDFIKAIKTFTKSLGWGDIKEIYVNKDAGNAVIDVYNNFECSLSESSKIPYSRFYKGMLTGYFTQYFHEEVKVEKLKCIAMGDTYCKFKIRKLKPVKIAAD